MRSEGRSVEHEKALRESEERFRVMADSIPQLAWLAKADGYIYWYNRRWFEYTGTTPEQMEGWGWQSVHDPDALPGVLARWKESIATGRPFDMIFPLRGADGTFRQFLTRVEPVKNAEGVVVQWCGTNTDITERKSMEEELRELSQRLSYHVDNSPLAVIEWGADMRLIRWSREAERMFGWRADEVLGKRMEDFRWIYNEDIGHVADVSSDLTTGSNPKRFSANRNYCKDGSIIHCEWYNSSLLDDSGKLKSILSLVLDVTERVRMEDELRRSESRFRLLSETAGLLLRSDNPQGIVNELCREVMEHLDCQAFFNFLVNERAGKLLLNAFAGIPEEEARKIEWLDYGVAVCGCAAIEKKRIIAEDIFHTPDIRTDLVKSYGIQAYACHPLMIQDKVIGTLSFGTKTRPRFSPDDIALMKTVADQVAVAMERIRLIEGLRNARDQLELRVEERTSELKSYMAKLEESNRALQDFASIASHDLQEPLRKVTSFVSMLKRGYSASLDERGKEYLNRVLGATDRMQSLIRALLEYSRVSTRGEEYSLVDLYEVVGEVLSDLEVRIDSSGAKIEIGELPSVKADPTQMRQLLQNLIGNALKFQKTGETPLVRIHGTVSDGETGICVEDNGIGFEEQYIDRIFAPFQRLHGREQYEGTGMGLAICKKIAERHGGTISAKSRPGMGAAFEIRLPQV